MLKKILAYLMVLPIICSLFINNVFADETIFTEGALHYTVNFESKTIVIVDYFGHDATVTVPGLINNTPVVEIASGAFTNSYVKNVILPDSVVTINKGAFGKGVKYETKNSINIDEGKTDSETKKEDNQNDKQKDPNEQPGQEINNNENPHNKPNGQTENQNISESGDVKIDDKQEEHSIEPVPKDEGDNNTSYGVYIYTIVGFVVVMIFVYLIKKKNDRR